MFAEKGLSLLMSLDSALRQPVSVYFGDATSIQHVLHHRSSNGYIILDQMITFYTLTAKTTISCMYVHTHIHTHNRSSMQLHMVVSKPLHIY